MKRSKYTTEEYNEKRRPEPDWLNEVNILRLTRDYPQTLNLYDEFYFDRSIYTVTELCICDLQRAIKIRKAENRPFTKDEVRQILAQILESMLVLHAKKILHRDLKPQNIMIRSLDPFRLCIIDFDVSMNLEGTNLQVQSKSSKAGTKGFISSDLSAKEYSFALDIQVFGIIAWRLCNMVTDNDRSPEEIKKQNEKEENQPEEEENQPEEE